MSVLDNGPEIDGRRTDEIRAEGIETVAALIPAGDAGGDAHGDDADRGDGFDQSIVNQGGVNQVAGRDVHNIHIGGDTYVTAITEEAPTPKRECRRCGHHPMIAASVVWQEHTQRSNGKVVHTSQLAERVAPPLRPWPPSSPDLAFVPDPLPDEAFPLVAQLDTPVKVWIAVAVAIIVSIAVPGSILLILGYIIRRLWIRYHEREQYQSRQKDTLEWRKESLNENREKELEHEAALKKFQKRLDEHDKEYDAWKRMVICRACGRRVILARNA